MKRTPGGVSTGDEMTGDQRDLAVSATHGAQYTRLVQANHTLTDGATTSGRAHHISRYQGTEGRYGHGGPTVPTMSASPHRPVPPSGVHVYSYCTRTLRAGRPIGEVPWLQLTNHLRSTTSPRCAAWHHLVGPERKDTLDIAVRSCNRYLRS